MFVKTNVSRTTWYVSASTASSTSRSSPCAPCRRSPPNACPANGFLPDACLPDGSPPDASLSNVSPPNDSPPNAVDEPVAVAVATRSPSRDRRTTRSVLPVALPPGPPSACNARNATNGCTLNGCCQLNPADANARASACDMPRDPIAPEPPDPTAPPDPFVPTVPTSDTMLNAAPLPRP